MKTDKMLHGKGKGPRKRWTRDDTELFLLSLPTLLWYAIFAYLPMFGIIIAFKVYKLQPGGHGFIYNLLHSDWAGFSYFSFLFSSNAFTMLLKNTVLYNIAFIIISATVAVGGALMLSNMRNKGASKVYQTMMFLPYFMSWVVIAYFVYAILTPERGYLNGILKSFGVDPIMWFQEAKYWPFILVLLNTWKGMGYGMVLYLASITGIDQSMYDAAVMAGAKKWQQTVHITLPSIKPVFIMMLILDCGKIFNSDFGLFYQVTGGIPRSLYTTVSTFDTFIYQAIRTPGTPIGRTAAASFFQAICSCTTILIANWVVRKIDNENSLI